MTGKSKERRDVEVVDTVALFEIIKEQLADNDARGLLLFIDIDSFHEINHRVGHIQGDAVLETVAANLIRACRDGDHVARMAGGDFALFLPNVGNWAAETVAQRIRRIVQRPITLDDHTVPIEASIGYIPVSSDNTDAHDLIRKADKALFADKLMKQERRLRAAATESSDSA